MTHRLRWADLPLPVRTRVETRLGAPVLETRSAIGGFSSSSAEIVTTAGGRRAFVKAVTSRINAASEELNRREAATLADLPRDVPAPRLLDAFSEGDWFVLLIEVADGELPQQPWQPRELDVVLEALDTLAQVATPTPLPEVPALETLLGPDLKGFDRVAADPPPDLDPWLRERLDPLREAAELGVASLAGDILCHSDLRADNLLVTADGQVRIVDWAWAARGARFADALQLLASVDDRSGTLGVSARIDAVMARHGTPTEVATDLLAGILGFFVDAARLPTDPSLPTLHEHRRATRDQLFPMVRARWNREGRD
ncbi:phosphotransferase [Brachybacterium sacelli]|uniref:Aminoglycoside phosphotransferase (APT) family kinase protein n=1 Tax=Brachybacterium sacelli TaxID=173364 RepID=A0ABS4WX89_9MICO|nr:aminoglycoside phosphotransferase (APT) family kinase protein [Brachybacterium sacelli]